MHRFFLLSLALASCTVDAPHGSVKARDAAPPAKVVEPPAPTKEVVAPPPTVQPVAEPAALDVLPRVAPAADAVVVVDAGAEPRRVLALGGREGDTRTMKLGLEMTVAMELASKRVPPTDVPPLAVTMRATITETNAEGVLVALAVTDVIADAPDGTTARVRDALVRTAERLRGTTGTMRIAKDGRVLAFDLGTTAAEAKPNAPALEPELGGLSAALQEILPAVPSEPVGDGARWTSIRHVRRDAVRFEQAGTWTLAIAGDVVTATLESKHVATTEGADAPGMVEKASGTTRATIVIGEGPFPTRATATIETATHANLELIGAPQRVGLSTTLTIALDEQ